ncbi:DNA binding domain-containing protein, excisionase family [Saccharopolyspora antimicrobica]|uniref:DNA binding domain-containing protein, excisionase family n=2 Tax=Saccharopolyspora antimicrobica TaxID=455193 RepID=A0A1I5LH55_9PSEU|nr:excisionase family DNA binding protein [Saccharopolyspora antimicrobica]SFO96523.1 DNA binding domain-containing protein, excisionase family [Saccharopolyspora antimicrobica]
MTTTLEHTVLPPDAPDEALGELARLLMRTDVEPGALVLVGPDGTPTPLPESVAELLRGVVTALAHGMAITVAPHNTMLTTQEAAELLGISRPTLINLLDDGEIPCEKTRGRHRRIRLADIVDYQERNRQEGEAVLDEMIADGEDSGLYEANAPQRTR